MIINYASSIVNKLEALLTDDARVIIYDRHVFIVQATVITITGVYVIQIQQSKYIFTAIWKNFNKDIRCGSERESWNRSQKWKKKRKKEMKAA